MKETGVPMKTVDSKILLKAIDGSKILRKPVDRSKIVLKSADSMIVLVLFLAVLVGLSALWFVTKSDVVLPRDGITVDSPRDLRITPMPPSTAPIPRQESSPQKE
jgi:hypothetical protein